MAVTDEFRVCKSVPVLVLALSETVLVLGFFGNADRTNGTYRTYGTADRTNGTYGTNRTKIGIELFCIPSTTERFFPAVSLCASVPMWLETPSR